MQRLSPILLALSAAFALTACGEVGDKAIKAAAKAILEEDAPINNAQPQAPAAEQSGAPIFPQDSIATDTAMPALPPKPAERQINSIATVVTRYGGKVIVRNAPSKAGKKLGILYTTERVYVLAETNNCETIDGLYGCWVRVQDSVGLTGYSFGGYLSY